MGEQEIIISDFGHHVLFHRLERIFHVPFFIPCWNRILACMDTVAHIQGYFKRKHRAHNPKGAAVFQGNAL